MENIIEITKLTKDYGNQKGIFDVTISVRKGEIYGFLGPNGAGKSTTIRHLMGFIRPDGGSCKLFGMDCFERAADIHKKLGYLAGEIAYMDDMTGRELLRFMAQLKGLKDQGRIQELVERFELDPSGRVRKMSKGMKQKVGIVSAFMADPAVLILDEPTSGLDPLMQNRFVELLLEEKKRGKTILMSSHIFEEIERTCDRTAIIRAGRIAAVEDMESLSGKKRKQYILRLEDGSTRIVDEDKNLTKLRQALAEQDVRTLEVKEQTLEELFLHYYDKER